MSRPSNRTMGGELVVRWRSEEPISTICFNNWCSVVSPAIFCPSGESVYFKATSGRKEGTFGPGVGVRCPGFGGREPGERPSEHRSPKTGNRLQDRFTQDLLQARDPVPDLLEPGHPERDHPLLDRLALHFDRGGAGEDHV